MAACWTLMLLDRAACENYNIPGIEAACQDCGSPSRQKGWTKSAWAAGHGTAWRVLCVSVLILMVPLVEIDVEHQDAARGQPSDQEPVHTCIYIYIYIYIYTHTNTHTNTQTHTHTNTYKCSNTLNCFVCQFCLV